MSYLYTLYNTLFFVFGQVFYAVTKCRYIIYEGFVKFFVAFFYNL